MANIKFSGFSTGATTGNTRIVGYDSTGNTNNQYTLAELSAGVVDAYDQYEFKTNIFLSNAKVIGRDNGTTRNANIQFADVSPLGNPAVVVRDGGSDLMIVDGSGKVGIGVTDPSAALEVLSTTTQLQLSYDGSNATTFTTASNGDCTIETSNLTISGLTTLDRKLSITSSTDGDAEGDIVYFGTGTTAVGKIYYFDGTDWLATDANTASSAASKGLLGVALGTAPATNGILIRGMITLDHDPGTIGDILYLSGTASEATSTAPSASGDTVRQVGYCLDSANGQIYFDPSPTYIELA